MVEKGRPDFDRMGHADAIRLHQNIIGQVVLLVEPEIRIQVAAVAPKLPAQVGQYIVQRQRELLGHQVPLLRIGERTVPENVSALGRHQAARQQPLDFVLQRNLVVRHGPSLHQRLTQAQRGFRQQPQVLRDAAGAIRQISAEQLIRAFAAQRDFGLRAAQLRQEPQRQRAGIGAGLVGVVCELLDRAFQILIGGIEVELLMLGAVLAHHLARCSCSRRSCGRGTKPKMS